MSKGNNPKIGVLLFSNNGLRKSGTGTPDGTYEERMKRPERSQALRARRICRHRERRRSLQPRPDLDSAMSLFQDERVDGVYVQYLSWAPDAFWMRFERDMPEMPVFFASVVPESIPSKHLQRQRQRSRQHRPRACRLAPGLRLHRADGRPMAETVLGTAGRGDGPREALLCRRPRPRKAEGRCGRALARHHEVMWSTYVDGFSLFRFVGPEMKVLANATVRREMDNVRGRDVASAVEPRSRAATP